MTDVSALEAYTGQIAEAAAMSGAASAKQHHYIHGDADSDVITESGPVPTIAKQARMSAEETAVLEGKLADREDPALGAGMVGMDGRWLRDYLKQQEYYLTIEYFGPTDTPANTKVTMQVAINFCAANGILLRGKAREYTIDVSVSGITIPNNFRCDLGGAKIIRKAGNKTPHDMWVNSDLLNGNYGLDIRGVYFDGQAQVDGLTNENPSHRFCGLFLSKCEGRLEDVRSDSTVNGEYQAEGVRGGILLQNSVFMDCKNLHSENTIGTGVLIDYGRGRLSGLVAKNNTGSGLSGSQGFWDLENLRSDGSGYSGISLNGAGLVARNVYGARAAIGFAGVNIGHVGPGIEAAEAIVDGVFAENNFGWGINCTGATRAKGRGWRGTNNGEYNLRITSSPGIDVEMESVGSIGGVIIRESVGRHFITLTGSGNRFTILGAGAVAIMGRDSIVQDCAMGTSGIQADSGASIVYSGTLRNNLGWGATAIGLGSSIVLDHARVLSNGTPYRTVNGASLRADGVRLNEFAEMDGAFSVPAGTPTVVVAAPNAVSRNRIIITAVSSAARGLPLPTVTSLALGTSFTVTLAGSTHTEALNYSYVLI